MKLLTKVSSIFNFSDKKKKNQVLISFTMGKADKENAEQVFQYVQECNGHLEIHRQEYEFFVPVDQRVFMLLKFPFLKSTMKYKAV